MTRPRSPAPQSDTLYRSLQRGCAALGVDPRPGLLDALSEFLVLLAKWNRVYNLTAVREPGAMVIRHVLDSLAVLPYLTAGRLLDAGTGAGLPGVPIALARPDLSVTLLDSSAKKLRFVRQTVGELGLDNAQVVRERMEQYRPARAFDMVISRAVADIGSLYRRTGHLVRPGGRFLHMQGVRPRAGLEAFASSGQLHVELLKVPGLDAERHLVWFEKQQDSGTLHQ